MLVSRRSWCNTPAAWAAAGPSQSWQPISTISAKLETAGSEHLGERLARQLLHDVVDTAVGKLAYVEDVDDIGMVDAGCAPGLGQESFDALWILGERAVEHLARAHAAKLRVTRRVDDSMEPRPMTADSS